MAKERASYHHGNLAESLLDAVNTIAEQFGIEAVTLRGCAKHLGVSPSSAFRHYSDKRALFTAFATRALNELSDTLQDAHTDAAHRDKDALMAVGIAYVEYALAHPALFRAMWREEAIYTQDPEYLAAALRLQGQISSGFAGSIDDGDPEAISDQELLLWSAVHGLANLYVDGNLNGHLSQFERLKKVEAVLTTLKPALAAPDQE
jgi:AcrR family transcriptional regulator